MTLNILNRISKKSAVSIVICLFQFAAPNVFAYDRNGNPFKPPGCQGKIFREVVDTITPALLSFGDKIYVIANADAWMRAGIVGVVDPNNPLNTSVALTIAAGLREDDYTVSSIGFWLESDGGKLASVAVPNGQDIRNPNIPYGPARQFVNMNTEEYTYNGLTMFGALNIWLHPSAGGSPNGTQVMHPDGRNMLTQAVISKTPLEFAAMYVRGMGHSKYWGVPGYKMMEVACSPNGNYSIGRTFLNFSGSSELKISAPKGKIEVTSGNVIYSAPYSCAITSDGVACPFSVIGASSIWRNAFRLYVPSSSQMDYWFINKYSLQKFTSIDVADIQQYSFVMSKKYLNSILGGNEIVDRFDDPKLELRATESGNIGVLIKPMENVALKRLTFGIALTERDPAAGGQYSGKVGQDSEIVVPLRIEQYGVSQASKMTVTVVADNVAMPKNGMRCKFVGNDGATVVGIPASLRFYNGNRQDEQVDNCVGTPHDITKMAWKPILGGAFPYQAYLDTDLFFPIGYRDVHLDINGNEWYGRVTASGQVKVKAEWN